MLDMGKELVEAYVEIDHSYLCDFMYEALCSEYQKRMEAVQD